MMSSADSTELPTSADEPTPFTGFDMVLLLEALAQVDSARIASETVLEATQNVTIAA